MPKVKFYSKEDLASGFFLKRVTELILDFEIDQDRNINEILELYNCIQYIDNELYLKDWSEELILNLKNKSKKIMSDIAKYFKNITELNLNSIIRIIDSEYKDDFLTLFCKFELTKTVTEDTFANMLKNKHFFINEICQHKKLVNDYSSSIKDILMHNKSTVELLFDKFAVAKKDLIQNEIHLPKNLTTNDINLLISQYIDSPEANFNYLELIVNNHNTKEFAVTDKDRWKANKKINSIKNDFFKDNEGHAFTYKIILERNTKNTIEQFLEGTTATIKIDETYLESTLDYPSILNNFIWLFNFIDFNGRVSFVSKKNNNSTLESFFNLPSRKDYLLNTSFRALEQKSHLTIHMYYQFLKKNDINLEEVISWFFTDYLKSEFRIHNYSFSTPSELSTYREKCRDILPESEYLLQQFRSFIEYGKINHDMLELSSSGINFNEVPSLIQDKYVYPNVSLNKEFFYLFSNQSNLGYLADSNKNKSTFFELLNSEYIYYNEFGNHQKLLLDYLDKKEYISIKENGKIKWSSNNKVIILKTLYYEGVVSFHRLPSNYQIEVVTMEKEDLVSFESSLLTRKEQDLLNYYLNDSKFQNGPKIRNKYSHGRLGNGDEDLNYNNYLTILRLVISLVLKINDEMFLNEIVNNND